MSKRCPTAVQRRMEEPMEVIDVKAAREYVMGNYPNDPLLKHIAVSLLEQLPKVEAEDVEKYKTWIPVSERLPEDDKNLSVYTDGSLSSITVLTFSNTYGVRPANRWKQDPCGIPHLDEYVTDGWEWSLLGEGCTHWIPLPEPPKEADK